MTTRFPDTAPLPEQAPEQWEAWVDWRAVRTPGNRMDPKDGGKLVRVFLYAPDRACAEARALMTLLLESKWNLHGASARAIGNTPGEYSVEVTYPQAFAGWGRVHRATDGLEALWQAANPKSAP